jgi:hypothetical protein
MKAGVLLNFSGDRAPTRVDFLRLPRGLVKDKIGENEGPGIRRLSN